MKTLLIRIIALLISFAAGVASVIVIPCFDDRPLATVSGPELTVAYAPDLIAAARHGQSITTAGLKPNSNDYETRGWLKDEITRYQSSAEYLRESIPLPLEDGHKYEVSFQEITGDNLKEELVFLQKSGVPLSPAHQYVWVWVTVDNIVCPSWSGVIDVSEPGLIFFEGSGG
jgi:hypothetical protein